MILIYSGDDLIQSQLAKQQLALFGIVAEAAGELIQEANCVHYTDFAQKYIDRFLGDR